MVSYVLSRLGKSHVSMNAVLVTAHLHWLHGDLHRFVWRHLLLFRITSSCLSTAELLVLQHIFWNFDADSQLRLVVLWLCVI